MDYIEYPDNEKPESETAFLYQTPKFQTAMLETLPASFMPSKDPMMAESDQMDGSDFILGC